MTEAQRAYLSKWRQRRRDHLRAYHAAWSTVGHIIPLSRGGEHSYANTQTLCRPCNSRKGARMEVAT